jgi:copper(I)-binding protein
MVAVSKRIRQARHLPHRLLNFASNAFLISQGFSMFIPTRFSNARALFISCLVLMAGLASAQTAAVKVDGAWARATVQGQPGTGAFMNITAAQSTQLVGVSTPVAGVAEVHQMTMEGNVMKMRAVPALDLPAGKTVQLKPGSYHLMLMDLKTPLLKDSTVPVTLRFKNASGVQSQLEVVVPVAMVAPGPGTAEHKH